MIGGQCGNWHLEEKMVVAVVGKGLPVLGVEKASRYP